MNERSTFSAVLNLGRETGPANLKFHWVALLDSESVYIKYGINLQTRGLFAQVRARRQANCIRVNELCHASV